MFAPKKWRPGPRGGQILTLRLPSRLVDRLAQLVELMGCDMSTQVVAELSAALSGPGPMDGPSLPAPFLAALYEAEHDDGRWERVRLALPRWQHDALRELARLHRTTQSKVLAALLAPQLSERVRVAAYALSRGIGYYQAQRELVFVRPARSRFHKPQRKGGPHARSIPRRA